MTKFNRSLGGRPKTPLKMLAAWLVLSLALACLPGAVSRQLKDRGRLLLAPGQTVARAALKSLRRWRLAWQYRGDAAEELVALHDQVRRLTEQNVVLSRAAARAEFSFSADAEQPAPLIDARAVEARVLGEQARTFLGHLTIVAADGTAELTAESLVLDRGAVLIDQGGNASLATSNLALTGGRVWGKLVEVGPQTAVVRRVNAIGYRGLVQIVNNADGAKRPLAQGVLEGTGDALCHIRMVDATAPVSVGDLVLAAEEQGVTDVPLVYGRITRTELQPGAAHWQIWMAPAIADGPPSTLTVLQPSVNEERLARRQTK